MDDSFHDISRSYVALDASERERLKAEKRRWLYGVRIPQLRVFGFGLLALLVFLHVTFVPDSGPTRNALLYLLVAAGYVSISWILIHYLQDRTRLFDVARFFLFADTSLVIFALYCSGGDRSWLYLLLMIRLADRIFDRYYDLLLVVFITLVQYVVMLLYLERVDSRAISWPAEAVKLFVVFSISGYLISAGVVGSVMRGTVSGAIRLARELIVELQAKSKELEQEKVRAEAANRAKSTFLASISHELRTPLNVMLGFAQMMGREKNRTSADREKLAVILRSGEHLLSLINDVISISKIEAGKMSIASQPVVLRELVAGLDDMVRDRARTKGLVLACEVASDVPDYVLGDEAKIRQVLLNLLGNAVKFTDEGSVWLRVAGDGDGRVSFEVGDTGYGIAEDEMAGLFDLFSQTESGRRAQEGTGLGLSISRSYVRLMGGDIDVRSGLGEGTVVRFTLELAEAVDVVRPTPEPGRVIGLAPGQRSRRILVVDDIRENRQLLTELLRATGFEVREARNGLEAIDAWQEWRPDLIWMDMRMPILDGYEATRKIRESEGRSRRTKIIAITASALESERDEILESGCDDILVKPFMEVTLFRAIEKYLGVEFVRESDESAADGREEEGLTTDDLGVLPGEVISELRGALELGDGKAAAAAVERAREHDGRVAEMLDRAVRSFRFEEVLSLLSRLPAGGA